MARNDSSIRIQDADRVFKSVCDNHAAHTIAFDFLRTNWNKLLTQYVPVKLTDFFATTHTVSATVKGSILSVKWSRVCHDS